MSYSRQQLYAMGEPLGDSATYRKADGGLVLGGGGGGGGSGGTTTNISELPEWARGYAKGALERADALSRKGFQKYDDPRIAGFSPMQLQAQEGAANMQTSGATGAGIDVAAEAAKRGLGAQYQAGQFQNQFQAPEAYQAGRFGARPVRAMGLEQYQMGPAERVGTESFRQPGAAEAYMSPYMQNVVDIQQREARRASDIAGQGQQAEAVGRGAFGGSRDALMRAERQRNLATQLGDIQATGQQAAFQNAQQQFNAEQNARLAAQQANQQAGLTTGLQNLNALLGVQSLGAQQGLQAQQLNQQAALEAQRLGEQSRQFGAGQGLQAASLGAQYGQAAQQLGEQSRQYGAGYGLQGLQAALQGAGQLGALGGQQFQQGMDINKLQAAYGAQQQALRQQGLSQQYQDFLDEQNYPYKQLGFFSDMIRGLPVGQQSTQQIYQAPGSMLGQVAGLGVGALGLSSLYNTAQRSGAGFAEGGEVHTYAGDRGSVTSSDFIQDKLDSIRGDTEALFRAKQAALARRDYETASYVDQLLASNEEMRAQNASINSGLGYAFDQLPAESQDNIIRAAEGGVVAFAAGGDEGERKPMSYGEQMSALGSFLADIPKHIVSYPGYGFNRPSAPETKTQPAAVADKFDRATATRREDYMGAASEDRGTRESKPTVDAHPSVAEARGIAQAMGQGDAFDSNFNKYYEQLTNSSKDQLKSIKDALLANAKESEDIKKAGLGKALAAFGFSMAAQASKPGQARRKGLAGLMESAAAASPTLYESAAETDRLARAAKDNAMKMNLEMAKYEVALKKGDQQTAATLANNLEQRKLQQAQLGEMIRSNKAKEGILATRAGATGNRMDIEMLRATGRAQEKATTHVQNIMKEWGRSLPKEWKAKGYTDVEQVRPILEKMYTNKFLPGSFGLSKSQDDEKIDVDLFS